MTGTRRVKVDPDGEAKCRRPDICWRGRRVVPRARPLRRVREDAPAESGDFPALALMGFPVFGAFTVFLGCGKPTVRASTASLLIATIPAFTALWVVALLEERLAAVGWAGVASALWGSPRAADKPRQGRSVAQVPRRC